jgi:hypothetical protein
MERKYTDYLGYDSLSIMRYGPNCLGLGHDVPQFKKNRKLSDGDIATIKHLFPAPSVPLPQLDQTYHSLPSSEPLVTMDINHQNELIQFANELNSQLTSLNRSSGLRIFVLAGNDQLDRLLQVVLQVAKIQAIKNRFRIRVTGMMRSDSQVRIYSF